MNEFEKKLQSALHAINREIDLTKILDGEPAIGQYKILSLEGVGGQAYLFRAIDEPLDRTVVIKLYKYRLDASSRQRAIQEGRALARISDPRVAKCYGCDFAGDNPFLILEDVDGVSLDKYVAGRDISLKEAIRITRDIACAIESAHREELLHLDLKPGNVMIDSHGHVKLIDFGLSKNTAADTNAGESSGTPAFMAPEQANGLAVDKRTDIFGIGALFHFLVSGRAPFEGEDNQAIRQLAAEGKPRPLGQVAPNLPQKLIQICNRCLLKDPSERFASTDLLIAEFDSYNKRSKKIVFSLLAVFGLLALAGWWLMPPSEIVALDSEGTEGEAALPELKIPIAVDSIVNEFDITVEFDGPTFEQPLEIADGIGDTVLITEGAEYTVSISPSQDCYLKVSSVEIGPSEDKVSDLLFPRKGESDWIGAGSTCVVRIVPSYANGSLEHLVVYATNDAAKNRVQPNDRNTPGTSYLSGKSRGVDRVDDQAKAADFVIPYRVNLDE